MLKRPASLFERWVLPGLAFKAVVIGGGYATGRELAEFFLMSGPRAALWGMAVATAMWSVVCVLTFSLAHATHSYDYRTFFRELLGPAWPLFEVAYLALMVLVLAVFGAAAGLIGQTIWAGPTIVGTLCLMTAIALTVLNGNQSVERLFKFASILIYGVYGVFLALCLSRFGTEIQMAFAEPVDTSPAWLTAGLSYAGYNVVGAVSILPVTRHMMSRRDAVIAGSLCGPLAMLPAFLLLVCMSSLYPAILAAPLPTDWLLARLQLPAFRVVFQLMVFCALWESGAACINAFNERVGSLYSSQGRPFQPWMRLIISVAILGSAIFLASRFGLIELIATGYRALTVTFLLIYVAPLVTIGAWRLIFRQSPLRAMRRIREDARR